MQVRLLGPVEVADAASRVVSLGGAKERVVLAVLALHANRVVSVARLEDALWGDEPPRTSTKTLQSYVSRLRRALTDDVHIESAAGGYVLRVDASSLDVAEAERLITEARDALATGAVDRAATAAAAEALWVLGRGNPAHAAFCEEALAALGSDGDPAQRARVLASLAAGRAWEGGEGEAADPLAVEAVELARRSGDLTTLADALNARSTVLDGSPDLDRWAEVNRELVALARRTRDPWRMGPALRRSAEVAVQRGDRREFDDVRAALADALFWLPINTLLENEVRLLEGPLDEAMAVAASELLVQMVVVGEAHLLSAAREKGDLEDLLPLLRDVAAGNPGISGVQAALGLWESELGNLAEAQALLDELMAGLPSVRRDASFAAALAFMTEVAVACGDRGAAQELRAHLRPWSGQIVSSPAHTAYGAADRYLAMAASLLGEHDDGEDLFARAAAVEEGFGAPVLLARTLLWWGRSRLAAGDAAGARTLLERCHTLATELGMKLVASHAAALLETGDS